MNYQTLIRDFRTAVNDVVPEAENRRRAARPLAREYIAADVVLWEMLGETEV
jgi:hypothetical protein